ncbi:ATP-grasp domain-containing protein [Hyphomicrobium sp. 1Nfss2.1]|uniref:ATP-grasp domain-containing protein n=1 Tax=Hyphomicrobium sp. 1Nfss2.1 TaxID=3413936 RepID=UPI003C7E14E2
MISGSVLIAALAGRGLAASARRAGYEPLVADAFGDSDTAEYAAHALCVKDAARIGFRTKQTLAALSDLAQRATSPPVGLVLGSGFEDRPKLIEVLARRYRILGNNAATIARCKDPRALAALLDKLSIEHPETQLRVPGDPAGWLSKRIGGSGGTHVASAEAEQGARRYYQRQLDGIPHSVLAVASGGGMQMIGISRQWSVGTGPRPYRYGGAVGPAEVATDVAASMQSAAEKLCAALRLAGLVSFDFLLAGKSPYLLEINPRPGATLDVFDDERGSLFHAHLAAAMGETPKVNVSMDVRAAAILYADPGSLDIGDEPLPPWTADRPAPGTHIPRYRPIATVYGSGASQDAALGSCRQRLDELGQMLYGQPRNRERNDNAEVQRPGPKRLFARSQAR